MSIHFNRKVQIMPLTKHEFSVIIFSKKKISKIKQQRLVAFAMRPLIYFTSLFGMQMIRYSKNDILKVKLYSKLYSLFIIFLTAALFSFLRPVSWRDTISDLPLYILTKSYGIYNILEVVYFVLITTFGNSGIYVKVFKKLDEIDSHFGRSKTMLFKIKANAIFVTTIPILLVSGTVWLRKFNIVNLGQHFVFFMIILQGSIVTFLVVQIYARQLIINRLIKDKMVNNLTSQRKLIYEHSRNRLFEIIFLDSNLLERTSSNHYCWFELMQLYDKFADCIYYFNEIYAGQVFLMFNTWLLCTLLAICRSLSPSVKYSEVFLNDLFMYFSTNSRPICVAKMCELLMAEKRWTISLLLHGLANEVDDVYTDQIQTMLDLVKARKVAISANVFTADISTVLAFGSRAISYTVIMIQYFYMRVFSNNFIQ